MVVVVFCYVGWVGVCRCSFDVGFRIVWMFLGFCSVGFGFGSLSYGFCFVELDVVGSLGVV